MSARVVAATHRDLEEAVRGGRFRADLYFRLCVLPIHVPPLRDRLEDLPELVEPILEELGVRLGGAGAPPDPELLAPLLAYAWPGNVRQLVHVMERLVVLCPVAPLTAGRVAQVIGEAPDFGRPPGVGIPETAVGAEADREVAPPGAVGGEEARRIAGALLATGGNLARAARRLGMPRTTLRYRVEVHGLGGLIPRD